MGFTGLCFIVNVQDMLWLGSVRFGYRVVRVGTRGSIYYLPIFGSSSVQTVLGSSVRIVKLGTGKYLEKNWLSFGSGPVRLF